MARSLDIDSVDLAPYDADDKMKESRLSSVEAAHALYIKMRQDDEERSAARARIDRMFDGAAPYDQAKLNASGQHLKTNLNFGEGQRYLDISLSAYVDLYSSLENLVQVAFKRAAPLEETDKKNLTYLLDREITGLMRSHPEFHSSFLRLCTTFIKHGVGVSFFDSPEDWMFRTGGLADLLVPQQSTASEAGVDIAIGKREYHFHELHRYIANEKAAKAAGWDVEEVKRVLLKSAKDCQTRTVAGRHGIGSPIATYEELQNELKNNDLASGFRNPTISVLHYWVREADGKVSHFISVEQEPKAFMFQKIKRFDAAEQAFIFFSLGVGTNGTLHSVRGLGHRIFNHVQTSNRMRCQHIDGAMLASTVILQPESQRALDELQFAPYGPYAVLGAGLNIVEKAVPNLSNAVKPALDDLSQQLQLNVDTVSTYGPNQSSPYRNQMQVIQDIDVTTRLSGASLNLFYTSWSRLMREMVRRIVKAATSNSKDPFIKRFVAKLSELEIPAQLLEHLDTEGTRAVRSIGNGSKADRLVALRELQGVSGQFDEIGRHHLIRDITATRVGYDLADRYVPDKPEKRPTLDAKIALLENGNLNNGMEVLVLENEFHGEHLQAHAAPLQELLKALDTGQADPRQALPVVQAFYTHINGHLGYAAGDATLQGLVKSINQVLQYAEEVINNTMKALEAEQRRAAEAQAQAAAQGGQGQGPAQGPAQGPSPADLKLQAHEIDMRIKREKADLEMRIAQDKFQQEQAIRDAKAALEFSSGKVTRSDNLQGTPNDPDFLSSKSYDRITP